MGFKSIELQVAIPRTQDAGKMQEQMMKQGQQFQETLTEQQLRAELLKRKQVNEYEAAEGQIVKEEEKDKSKQSDEHQQSSKEYQDEAPDINHPYLGKYVDFTG